MVHSGSYVMESESWLLVSPYVPPHAHCRVITRFLSKFHIRSVFWRDSAKASSFGCI